MMILILQRLDDWETDSMTGYISSISSYGGLLTYGNYYNSYMNDTITGESSILFEGTNVQKILTVVYDGI